MNQGNKEHHSHQSGAGTQTLWVSGLLHLARVPVARVEASSAPWDQHLDRGYLDATIDYIVERIIAVVEV